MENNLREKIEPIMVAIRHAFGDVTLGNGISLHEADAIDVHATDEQRKQARALDSESHWWEIPPEDIEQLHGALYFMDAEGFRYYLPAYLMQALKNCMGGSLAMDTVLNTLFPVTQESEHKFSLLSQDQKKAIAQFLWFVATETNGQWENKLNVYNATKSLEGFWYPHLN